MIGLNVRSQKLHGIKDSRWTTFEKVALYKELLSLQKRDMEVTKYQKAKMKRQEERQLGELRKIAKQKQDELRNALAGNQNRMWTTLGEHRNIQLAQGRNTPEVVIENLYQMIDHKRKTKDKHLYAKHQLMKKYKDVQLKKGELDELLIMQKSGVKTAIERKMQGTCLAKQNAAMRRIAATSVRLTYIHILKILKKDAIYYDSVLNCLETDCSMQSQMLITVTEMGQIVTEILDDLTEECNTLDRGIKANMREREKTLNEFREVLLRMGKSFKDLVRSDSDIYVNRDNSEDDMKADGILITELDKLNEILKQVQYIALVSGYEHVYPNLLIQSRQRDRLQNLANNLMVLNDSMRTASIHLEAILHMVNHTYNEEKIQYLEKKRNLLRAIRAQQKRIEKTQETTEEENKVFQELRYSFRHMWVMLKPVRLSQFDDDSEVFDNAIDADDTRAQFAQMQLTPPVLGEVRDPISAIPEGENSLELVEVVQRKLHAMWDAFQPDGTLTRQAELFFNRATMEIYDEKGEEQEIDLLAGLVIEDSRLPSHASVKKASRQWVLDHTVDELALVAAQVAARTKPGAYFRKLMKAEEKRRKSNKYCGVY